MEQIEQRKEKAAELSSGRHANTDYAPKLTPYERKKQCSLCGVVVRDSLHSYTILKPFVLTAVLGNTRFRLVRKCSITASLTEEQTERQITGLY